MKILFAGGGTAGHINPAIAIANYIKSRHTNAEIAFVGTERGMENKLVPKEGYPLYHIDIQGFQRKICWNNVKTMGKAVKSLHQAEKILKEFKPDIVVGTGGYVSGPVLFKAAKMGIKTIIHEQNALPGVTSKILSRVVDKVLISFDDSRRYFKTPNKLVLTGNPVRENMKSLSQKEAKKALGVEEDTSLVVCFAGSLGAAVINHVMVEFIKKHKNEKDMTIIYATGERYYEGIAKTLGSVMDDPKQYANIRVERYIYNMDEVMAAADLLICRSGAMTISEIACMGKASVLIPSPNVTGNHQYFNAKSFCDVGGAMMIEEKDLTEAKLYYGVQEVLKDNQKRAEIERQVKLVAHPHATAEIYGIIMEFIEENEQK